MTDAGRRRRGAAALLCALGFTLALPAVASGAVVATVAAASDLKFVIEELAARFEKETGHRVRAVFGSSGNFYAQLRQGAPFHLFMSADEVFVLQLADAGLTEDRGRVYARGRIGLLVPRGSALKADGELRDLAQAVKDGRLQRLAIANPQHAPYGMRAREALRHAGIWPQLEGRLVLGENVSQAAQFALSGSAQAGIVAQSLALAPRLREQGEFALIPEAWHQPLVQRMVLMKSPPPAARAFHDYLATPAAQDVMARHGFIIPRP